MLDMQLPEKLDVLVVLGSLSDKKMAEKMVPVFDDFGVRAHFSVCSAHRDHERLAEMIPAAEKAGCKVVIGVAGMAAHLPGVIAALTVLPVIGVPCDGSLQGLDALLAIAQMPPGIPVATTAVNGGYNAALMAIEIMGSSDPALREKLLEFRVTMRQKNRANDQELRDGLKN